MRAEPRRGIIRSVARITPGVRRLVIAGPEIADFATPPGTLGPYLKLHLAGADGRACVRTYSIRRLDAAAGEMQVDFVLHPGGSVGSAFAEAAAPGDGVILGGPGYMPARPAPAYLLAGDHTALPAIAQILEHLPGDRERLAIVEVPDEGEEQDLPGVRWLHRRPGAPSRLAEAVRDAWPGGDLLLFAGAEAAIARAIRRHARDARGLPADRCQVLNYWKQGRPEGGFSYVA